MSYTQKIGLAIGLILSGTRVQAQIAGAFSVPNDFPTIAAAVTTLNAMGVAGGVTINISAGHTETAVPGGLKLFAIAGTSYTSQVIFRKSGAGANPSLVAYSGSATPTSSIQDGVWWLIGTDYVTIDGIDIVDPNTSGSAMMEFGYGFYKLSSTNGCQHNTVRNCVVTLNSSNSINAPTSFVPGGSRGIDMISASYTMNGVALTASLSSGGNSYNSIHSNLIRNCQVGIAMYGATTGTPGDMLNDVGGTGAVTGNTVINFGGGTGTAMSGGILTSYQQSLNVSYNIINNNTGAGLSPQQPLNGIRSGYPLQTMETIEQNTITVSATGSISAGITGIWDDTPGGSTFSISISRNVFPSYSYSNAVNASGAIIHHGAGSSGRVRIDSNSIGNIEFGTGTFTVINSVYASACSISGNTLTAFSAKSGVLHLVNFHYSSDMLISNNRFSNVSFTGPGTHTTQGIVLSPGSNGEVTVTNNLLQNFTGGGTASGSLIKGIWVPVSTGYRTINSNTIHNVSTYSGAAYGFSFTGVELTGNKEGQVKGNSIYDVRSIATNTSPSVTFIGILVSLSGSAGGSVSENKVGGFRFSSGGGMMALVRQLSGGANMYFSQNVLGDVDCPNLNGESLYGILISSGSAYVYYNSVFLNSSANSGLDHGSAALSVSTSTVTLRNNILVNLSATAGAGTARVLYGGSSSMNWVAAASNNNLYYAGTPGPSRVIAQASFGNYYSTLAAYQQTVSPRENLTATENVPFAAITATSQNFLDLNPAAPTRAESAAVPIAAFSYTADYAGNIRHPYTPDIGAWEGNFTPADVFAPAILASGFSGGACSTSGRTLTVSVYDPSGVATGSLAPRLYYRKNFTLYSSVQGTLSAGTVTNGTWSFNLSYTATTGDMISYFLAIQDQSPQNNLAVFPANSYSATDVNNVSVPPLPPHSYTLTGSVLSGTYLVGSGQTFTTLTQAINAYNTSCLNGPVTFSLTDASYSTNETFPVTIRLNTDASATNALLIRPAAGVASTISAVAAPSAVIALIDARHVRIDGMNQGGSSLLITNANSGTATVIWLASGTGPLQGNSHVTITNQTIRGSASSGTLNFGILSSASSPSIDLTPSVNNDDIEISNSSFLRVGTGIFATASSSNSAAGSDRWLISGNFIGPPVTGTNNIRANGILLRNCTDFSITANTISNASVITAGVAGINLYENVNNTTISQNTISAIVADNWIPYPAICGIYAGLNLYNCSIHSNVISGISNIYSSGNGAAGIVCDTWDGTGNRVFNNMVSGIISRGDYSSDSWPAGILLMRKAGNISIDHNSVNLAGSHTGRSVFTNSFLVTAALYVNSTGSGISVRNNILANSYDFSNHTTDRNYSFYSAVPMSAYSAIDNNNYYAGTTSTNNPVPAYCGDDLFSLAAIQASVGGNAASSTLAPVFTSSLNLHLQAVPGNSHLDDTGQPLSWVLTDIDGQPRSSVTPDVGADEFSTATCSLVSTGTVTPGGFSACSGQTITLTASGTWTDSGISYQWQAAPTSGGSYTNVGAGTGATQLSYSTPPLPAGTVYYRMKATCSASGYTAATNEVTVVVGATPVVTATVSPAALCSGNGFTLAGSSSVATTYVWNGPSGYTATVQNAIVSGASTGASGVYTLTGFSGSCGSAPVTVTVLVQPTPTLAISGNTIICSGNSTTLTATGADTYSWSTGNTGASVTLAPVASAVYSVTGSFTNGCASTRTVTVMTNSLPVIVVSPGSGSVCAGRITSYSASGASTYSWSNGFTGSVLTLTPTTPAFYTLTGTSAAGCASTQSLSVGIHTVPVLGVSASAGSVCSGGSVSLTASGASGYTWTPGNILSASAAVNPTATTTYTVKGDNSAGCVSQTVIAVNAIPLPTVTAPGGTVCMGSSFTIQPSGASSYTYSGGSAVVTPTANTSYSIYGSSAAGCTASSPAVINVVVAPLPTISVNSGTMCAGTSFTIVPSGAASYAFPAGGPVVNPSSDSSYPVTGVSAAGCASGNTAIATVTVVQAPVLTVNNGTVCSGKSFVLTPSGAVSYTFSGGSATVTPPATTNYSVWGTGSSGCISNSPAVAGVTVSPSPTVSAAGGTICSGNSFTISPLGASGYTFSSGPVVSPASTTAYSVTGVSAAGCLSTNTAVVTVVVNPIPTISVNSGTLCSGQSFTLTPTGATSYTFSGGSAIVSPTANSVYSVTGSAGGCVSAGPAVASLTVLPSPAITAASGSVCSGNSFTIVPGGAVSYTYSGGSAVVSPGTSTSYTVSGTSSLGCVSAATVLVTVYATPTISVNSGTVCEGGTFTMIPGGALTYTFSSGSATVTPLASGSYSVTGTGSGGCLSNMAVSSVTLIPTPTVSVNSGTICAGSVFTLLPSGATSYTYSGGSNTVQPVSGTSYSVYGSTSGCTSTNAAVANVYVNSLPVVTVSGPSLVCSGAGSTLTAAGAVTYTWNASATGSTYVHTPVSATNVTVQGTDINGCTGSAVKTVSVIQGASISITGGTTVCEGTPVSLFASGNALTYSWSTGQTGNLISVTPSASTVYSVTGTGLSGCPGTASIVVFVNSAPLLQANASSNNICIGEALTLSGSGAVTYTWSGGVINNVPFFPTTTNTYSLTGTAINGCRGTASVLVNVHPLPVVTITADRDTICEGETVTLSANGANYYSWSPSGGGLSSVTVSVAATAVFTVTGTDVNGCKSSAQHTVNVDACAGLGYHPAPPLFDVYPTPFTDFFNVVVSPGMTGCRMEVYNDLAQLVFSGKTEPGLTRIDGTGFAKGIYFVRMLRNSAVVAQEKMVKME